MALAWLDPQVVVAIASGAIATTALSVAAWQLRVQAQAAHVEAWAYLLDTCNRRWAHYISARDDQERRFALGELVNFLEVLARDIDQKRLPKATRSLMTPYLCGMIDLMARHASVNEQIRTMRKNPKTFCELHAFCERRIDKFGDYAVVGHMLGSPPST